MGSIFEQVQKDLLYFRWEHQDRREIRIVIAGNGYVTKVVLLFQIEVVGCQFDGMIEQIRDQRVMPLRITATAELEHTRHDAGGSHSRLTDARQELQDFALFHIAADALKINADFF